MAVDTLAEILKSSNFRMSAIFRAVAAKEAQIHGFTKKAISSAVQKLDFSPALESALRKVLLKIRKQQILSGKNRVKQAKVRLSYRLKSANFQIKMHWTM